MLVDRVLIKGFAYDNNNIFQTGLLKGKTASLVVTTKSNESAYQGCPIKKVARHFEQILQKLFILLD